MKTIQVARHCAGILVLELDENAGFKTSEISEISEVLAHQIPQFHVGRVLGRLQSLLTRAEK